MAIEFLPDIGSKITHNGRSLILSSSSVGKESALLTDRNILDAAKILSQYLTAVGSLEELSYRRMQITPAESPEIADDVAYKFTDENGLAHWLKGSVKLDPPAHYLTIENPLAQDVREGRGLLYIQGKKRFATLGSISGFNSLILCTSVDARRSEREYRTRKFGRRIIKINRAREFAAKLAKFCGADRYVVRDVTYSDAKAVKWESGFPEDFVRVNGMGDLKDDTLNYIGETWLDQLIFATSAASIFTKPLSFRLERERRFQFEFSSDTSSSKIITDKSLLAHIEAVA